MGMTLVNVQNVSLNRGQSCTLRGFSCPIAQTRSLHQHYRDICGDHWTSL